ncbi:MAG: hypothetical protein EPN99_16560 [Frankiales bacterium]|nr:MAG: hypothetical protein EPN99_16560 [Frankiales bacterium]
MALGGTARETSTGRRHASSRTPGAGIVLADPDDMERELDAVVDSGARWVRLDVDRSQIEGTRGSDDGDHVDRVVDAARERDIKVLALLACTPAWARPAALRDAGTDADDREDNVGLLRRDVAPEPAFHRLRALLG